MGRKVIDKVGNVYGELTVIKRAPNKNKRIQWECECSCTSIVYVLSSNLEAGNTISCGCFNIKNHTIHGLRKHPLYTVWRHMIQRCYNPTTAYFINYGKRGITVYEEWKPNPTKFIKWAESNGYAKGLQIDRENNDGNYCPTNCRFVSPSVNNCNRRKQNNNTSGYIGVLTKNKNKFCWKLKCGNLIKSKYGFKTAKEAAIARNEYIKKNKLPNQLNEIKEFTTP